MADRLIKAVNTLLLAAPLVIALFFNGLDWGAQVDISSLKAGTTSLGFFYFFAMLFISGVYGIICCHWSEEVFNGNDDFDIIIGWVSVVYFWVAFLAFQVAGSALFGLMAAGALVYLAINYGAPVWTWLKARAQEIKVKF